MDGLKKSKFFPNLFKFLYLKIKFLIVYSKKNSIITHSLISTLFIQKLIYKEPNRTKWVHVQGCFCPLLIYQLNNQTRVFLTLKLIHHYSASRVTTRGRVLAQVRAIRVGPVHTCGGGCRRAERLFAFRLSWVKKVIRQPTNRDLTKVVGRNLYT